MNLVQLSEQLKDVPDNFLMTEVQNPTGAYPAYLIVSEMTRRKRMRENAPKQEPQTTVAEDLMSGGIRAMQPQMPQQMPQQPGAAQAMASQMPMPQMPQQMPQEPQMMAGGGLVAFEQGGPIRAQSGLFANLEEDMPVSFEDELESYRPRGFSALLGGPQGVGSGDVRYKLGQLGYTKETIDQMDPAMQRMIIAKAQIPDNAPAAPIAASVAPLAAPAPRAAPAPLAAPPRGAGGASKVATPGPGAEAIRISQELAGATAPSYNRPQGIEALRTALPDTASTALADYIGKQEGQMKGQRESNLNMALMQAGLGMMGSRARSGIQGIAEGGLEGLKSYRQGMAELQKGEQQIELARIKMAEAKDARERGLFDLSLKEEANANEMFKQGQEAKYRAGSILAAVESARRPTGRTADVTPSPAEVKSVREQVQQALTAQFLNSGKKFDPNSPEFKNAVEQEIANQFVTNYGKIYRPMMMGAPASQRGDFNAITAGP
jgi:hypothetical protein